MTHPFFAAMCVLLLLNGLFEWTRRRKTPIRELRAFFILSALGWVVVLYMGIFYKGPTPRDLIDFFFMPVYLWLNG
ncbi:hypothetical protein M3650_11190 [Paenibacillus sp. MER TA 81-3]|uniref:hypothetical protein n=1 Tax=Paenibacillus sp. MER TA 81-3 TaxID=2939573 RepID=UPI00203E2E63|nr:hypothetical protein [Paenibacillus sp. MER TA 81-3]MCM3339189.1 hypothetical protein [Paenibacillus sp. MER TA 81-3]